MLAVGWYDKRPVCLLTNIHSSEIIVKQQQRHRAGQHEMIVKQQQRHRAGQHEMIVKQQQRHRAGQH